VPTAWSRQVLLAVERVALDLLARLDGDAHLRRLLRRIERHLAARLGKRLELRGGATCWAATGRATAENAAGKQAAHDVDLPRNPIQV